MLARQVVLQIDTSVGSDGVVVCLLGYLRVHVVISHHEWLALFKTRMGVRHGEVVFED